jgi:hypothetical protein
MKWLLLFSLLSANAAADISFRGNLRVSSSYDVIRFLRWKFQLPDTDLDHPCTQMGFTEHIIAGTMISTLQARLMEGPEPSFEEWFAGCVGHYAHRATAWEWTLQAWDESSLEYKRFFIERRLEEWIGPDFVLEELGLTGPNSTLEGQPLSRADLVAKLIALPVQFEDGRTATVADAYRFYATIILTLPELRAH